MDSYFTIKMIFSAINKGETSKIDKNFKLINAENSKYLYDIISSAIILSRKNIKKNRIKKEVESLNIGPGYYGDWVDYSSPWYYTDFIIYGINVLDYEFEERAYFFEDKLSDLQNNLSTYQLYLSGLLNDEYMKLLDKTNKSERKAICFYLDRIFEVL